MDAKSQFDQALTVAAEALEVQLADEKRALLYRHFEALMVANAQFNLTRITDPAEAAVKLYADSLAPLAWLRDAGAKVAHVLDVGTGAGFPAVPLAVVMPAWKVTALDSTGKKARYVAESAAQLGLTNVRALHERAGQWPSPQRFHAVLFKAVGTLQKCLESIRGLVAHDGYAIVFKGRGLSRAELDAGQRQAESQGMQTWDTADYTLPLGAETLEHSLIVYRRMA
ncbi:MAG TPA: 16S rRNA (guanine(527)-N(7))-methyltransferase RsmG [Phycisphaerae bacterium]|nr:16S rRNA (guanine(527)-N(7))-methyltransferase RsmG [Caldilineaceae bacterium]MCB9866965.1 16S rRNA (guanine(527)-N(7))-methyltransferase RsmG [Phycisphaerales bacterium]HRX83977.1 16S rRNA (guanine(527)-N(7))-methyltransferase RsmG [Phycisphaerae bacterium]